MHASFLISEEGVTFLTLLIATGSHDLCLYKEDIKKSIHYSFNVIKVDFSWAASIVFSFY